MSDTTLETPVEPRQPLSTKVLKTVAAAAAVGALAFGAGAIANNGDSAATTSAVASSSRSRAEASSGRPMGVAASTRSPLTGP